MLGKTLGRYRILDRLGAGGMGTVWLAEDLELGRKVALKTLHEQLPASDERRQRFEREARAVAALNHPNVVTLYSVEHADGVRFLTMEYVEGQPLGARIAPGGLPPSELLRIGAEIADALAAAHARGIVHRDLKPANVLVGTDGRVRVVDFGVARSIAPSSGETGSPVGDTSLTRDGVAIGTLNYMSPEQLAARAIDARSDLFSLGIVLFEMATGELPFAGDSAALMASSILRDPPRRIDEHATKLPPQVLDLIEALLAKSPDDRPVSAAEVRDRLRATLRLIASETEGVEAVAQPAATRRPPHTVRVPLPSPAAKPPRRAGAWLALAALVFLAGAAAIVFRAGRRPAPAPPSAAAPPAVPAIAVLAFRSFSADPDYVVDGVTDGLIDSLARVGGLRVISRQSAMHFKSSDKLLADVAHELGVDYVVEGSVARQGDRVQVRAKLLRPSPEAQLWSQSYDRPLAEFLAVEAEVTAAIAKAVKGALSPEESARLAAVRGVDPAAHDLYLRGRYQANQRTAESLELAVESFRAAIRVAPDFVAAHASLADAWSVLARQRGDAHELHEAARADAERALALDPTSVDALVAKARVDLYADWRWAEAERGVRAALALNPSHAEAHMLLWNLETAHGRVTSAAESVRRALELDPLSVGYNYYLGIQRFWERDFAGARAQLERTLALAPEYGPALLTLWGVESKLGDERAAFDYFRRALPRLGFADLVPAVEAAMAVDGFRGAMREAARQFAADRGGKPRWVDAVPYVAAFAGDREVALDWLERAYELRAPTLIWIRANPAWDAIREEPRFRRIVERMGLAASA